jgi:hypothetical protein
LRWRPLSDWRTPANVDKVIEQLVTDKADMTAAIAALVKLKPAASALPTTEQLNTAVQAALTAERTRVTDIRGVAKQLKLDGVPTLNAKVDEIIAAGTSVNDARIKLVDLRAKHEESVGPIVSFSGNARPSTIPSSARTRSPPRSRTAPSRTWSR